MRSQREPSVLFPVLLLEPNGENAARLAARLEEAGFRTSIEASAYSALQAQRRVFFFAMIVVADLTNEDCLATLATLRRRAPDSWMIVAAPECDPYTCELIHRHGGDACVASPISPDDLIGRLDAFQLRARPSF